MSLMRMLPSMFKKSLTGHRQNCIIIFGDSVTRIIRVRNFDRELNAGHVKIKTFPTANSREFSQYFTPTLEDSNFDAVILLRNRN